MSFDEIRCGLIFLCFLPHEIFIIFFYHTRFSLLFCTLSVKCTIWKSNFPHQACKWRGGGVERRLGLLGVRCCSARSEHKSHCYDMTFGEEAAQPKKVWSMIPQYALWQTITTPTNTQQASSTDFPSLDYSWGSSVLITVREFLTSSLPSSFLAWSVPAFSRPFMLTRYHDSVWHFLLCSCS